MAGPEPNSNQDNAIIWPELWSAFAKHRQKVTELLLAFATQPGKSLCVLGAGRTTDLDLIPLAERYAKIDLVDLHPTITRDALVQRGFDGHARVSEISMLDVSGIDASWRHFMAAPSEGALQATIKECKNAKLDLGQYDVVVSTCLLTQIMRRAFECLEAAKMVKTNGLSDIVKAIREKHFDLLVNHTVPGGAALLITDLTSSEALPEMLLEGADLQHMLVNEVTEGNHFPGMNPKLIFEATQRSSLGINLQKALVTRPWIWNSIEMQYLCIAYLLSKNQ